MRTPVVCGYVPIDLNLSAPIDKALAAQVRLVGGGAKLAPKLDEEDANAVRNLVFGPAGFVARDQLPAGAACAIYR